MSTKTCKNFVCIRHQKIHEWGNGRSSSGKKSETKNGTTGAWSHDIRFLETPNADPKRMSKNMLVCAETGWKFEELSDETKKRTGCMDPEFITRKAKAKLKEHNITPRPDQVKASMLVAFVSPEYLRAGTPDGKIDRDRLDKWAKGTLAFTLKKYKLGFLAAIIHDDELNPHMHIYLVPLVEKDVTPRGPRRKNAKDKRKPSVKKVVLSCNDMFGPDPYHKVLGPNGKIMKVRTGKGTCSQMQDEYAATLQAHGLDVVRGARTNGLQKPLPHQTIAKLHGKSAAISEQIASMSDAEVRKYAEEIANLAADAARLKKERDHYHVAASDYQRSLPVGDVISALTGLAPLPEPHPNGGGQGKKKRVILTEFLLQNGQRIGISAGNKFENLTPEIPFLGSNGKRMRGKGAVDAVVLITGWTPQQAIEWIADNFGTGEAKKAAAEKIEEQIEKTKDDEERAVRKDHAAKITRELETPDESQWPAAMEILTKTFNFHPDQIKDQHKNDWIDANKFGHLVFKKGLWDEKDVLFPTGKIIVDPKNPDAPLLETGDAGLYMDLNPEATGTIICASPLDALVLRSMPEHHQAHVIAVGRNPNNESKRAIEYFLGSYDYVRFAENLTTAGKNLAAWLNEVFGDTIHKLLLPDGFRHWLEYHLRPTIKVDSPKPPVVRPPEKGLTGPTDIEMS